MHSRSAIRQDGAIVEHALIIPEGRIVVPPRTKARHERGIVTRCRFRLPLMEPSQDPPVLDKLDSSRHHSRSNVEYLAQ